MGGEKPFLFCGGSSDSGSPPHGRGKVVRHCRVLFDVGITPAWAGKSLFCFAAAVPIQDHPRMGGEKLYDIAAFCSMWGSPPRGRGKEIKAKVFEGMDRITPAWAGKRRCTAACNGLCWDHPRMGGEKHVMGGNGTGTEGSPPRGRGKGGPRAHAGRLCGITPA